MPTLILREAWVLAAQAAGGGGKDGVVNYLTKIAHERPNVFVSGLARIMPLEVTMNGGGTIVVRIVKDFDDLKTIEHKPNGVNGHANGSGHRDHDPE